MKCPVLLDLLAEVSASELFECSAFNHQLIYQGGLQTCGRSRQ